MAATELKTSEKLSLIAVWRRSDREDLLVYGALLVMGVAVALFGPNLPQLTGLKQTEMVAGLLGTTTVPGSALQLWRRFKSVRVLAFLTQAYSQDIAVAHADIVFDRRLSRELQS